MIPRIPLLAAATLIAGCELAEVTVATPEEVVVAEIHFRTGDSGGRGFALLYRSTGHPTGVPGAEVRVRSADGTEFGFDAADAEECLDPVDPERFEGSCFLLSPEAAGAIVLPLTRLEVEVRLPDGGRILGGTTVPGAFDLVQPGPDVRGCTLAPSTTFPLEWERSTGAWAYFPEVDFEVLASIPFSLTLVGLSISEADTGIVFPSEFGLFQRFGDDRELLVDIQDGLPADTRARIVVSAADRNTVNWLRGGNFNPSGQIRIPSLFGDGTGVVGSSFDRALIVEVGVSQEVAQACAG